MAEIPQYQVDSGDFTPEEILDVIPEQERLDRQVQNDEEKYLRQLEQNAEDRIRNTEKMWGGIAKLSTKVGDILKEKQDKHRKEVSASLKNRVLMFGVGENLAAHFSGEKRDLFDESLQIHKTASQIESLGDLVTAEDYRDMSQWEQEAIQEEYARKKGVGYEAFVENEKLTTSIEVTDADGSVRTVKFANGDLNAYQPNAAEIAALNEKIQYKFAYQLDGIENEGLIAEQIRPHVLTYNQKLQNQAVQDRANARKITFQNQQFESMTTIIENGTPQEAKDLYEDYVSMYRNMNDGATMLEANTQFSKDLDHLVRTGKISQSKALALTDNRFEFNRGKDFITNGAGLSDLRTKILLAGNAYNQIKEQEKDSEAQSYANILRNEMGPISDQQAVVLTKAFNIKYKGNIPSKIRNVLKGYRPDDEAIADLETWKRAQGGKLYGYQVRNVSNAVYDKYKDILVGAGGPTENGTSAYKLNQKLFDAKTQTILKSNYGVGDIKSENFLYLRANVEEIYNDAYNVEIAAGRPPETANKTAMLAVDTFLDNPNEVAKAQKPDLDITQQEERYVDDVSTGREQGKNNQWKTSRMSMAGLRADEELLAWSKKTDRTVADMPRYYVDVARQLGIAPETFGLAQVALITQEPIDEKALAKEMSEDEQVLRGIFNHPNSFSVIQSVMMLEQEGEEVTTDNSLFNNPSVTNEDI